MKTLQYILLAMVAYGIFYNIGLALLALACCIFFRWADHKLDKLFSEEGEDLNRIGKLPF